MKCFYSGTGVLSHKKVYRTVETTVPPCKAPILNSRTGVPPVTDFVIIKMDRLGSPDPNSKLGPETPLYQFLLHIEWQ